MIFSYERISPLYTIFIPIESTPYLSGREVYFGEFIISFALLDLPKIQKEISSLKDNNENLKAMLKENCELYSLGMLLYEDLTTISSNYNLSIYQSYNYRREQYTGIQEAIKSYLIQGIMPNDSNFYSLITQNGVPKIEANFCRPDEFGFGEEGICINYSIHDVASMIAFDLMNVLDYGIQIKQCANCSRFFIPDKRSDEIYCNRIYRNGKTCKELGYSLKIASDPFKAAFTKARKTQHARIRYNKHIKDYKEKHYEPWLQAATQARDEYKSANNIEGFENWIEEHKNAF